MELKGIIREARLEDAEGIARVHVVSWQAAYRGIMSDGLLDALSIPERTADWRKRLESPVSRLSFVLEIDDRIEGWVSLGSARDQDKSAACGELYGIYLTPEYWSQKWGTRLYAQAEKVLREQPFTAITVWVLEANERARRFYEKAGYVPDGHVTTFGSDLPEMRYEKQLN